MRKIRKCSPLAILTLIWATIIFVFSIILSPQTTGTSDIVLHFSAYAIFTVLALSSTKPKMHLGIIIAIVLYGFFLEILQNFIGRTFSFADMLVNCIGILVSVALFSLCWKWAKLLKAILLHLK
jgi:VanZ family protein